MKKFLSLFLFLLLSSQILAQELECRLQELPENFNYPELENGLEVLQSESTKKIKYKWNIQLQREIADDHFEQIIEVTKEEQDIENPYIYSVSSFKIKLLRKQEEISYYKVVKIKHVKRKGSWVPDEILLVKNTYPSRIENLKAAYSATYHSELNFRELFETEIVFGSSCGFSGLDPLYRVKLNRLLENKDTATLIRWLSSATVELQLYAIDGILNLKNQDVAFDQSVIDLIAVIENKKGDAYTCSGCTHWNQPIKETVERIKTKHRKKEK